MDANIAQIAASTATFIAPFTPYLLETGKAVSQKWIETVAELGGEATWERAKLIWEKIHSHYGHDLKVKGAALVVSADPEDRASRMLFAKALGECLEEDPQIAQELLYLLGGSKAVQEVLADRDSWVEEVTQQIKGSGTQSIKSSNDSIIRSVHQIKE